MPAKKTKDPRGFGAIRQKTEDFYNYLLNDLEKIMWSIYIFYEEYRNYRSNRHSVKMKIKFKIINYLKEIFIGH